MLHTGLNCENIAVCVVVVVCDIVTGERVTVGVDIPALADPPPPPPAPVVTGDSTGAATMEKLVLESTEFAH